MDKSTLSIKIAKEKQELSEAFQLLEHHGLAPSKHHTLPSTSLIIASHKGTVVGAACLYGESPFLLPLEKKLSLQSFRAQCNGRIAELSPVALSGDFRSPPELARAIHYFAACFASSFCHYEYLLSCPNPTENAWLQEALGYNPLLASDLRREKCFALNLCEMKEAKNTLPSGVRFEFPEKRFFLVNHHVMTPELLDEFFNKKYALLETLSDAELRVLKNIYDFGEYAPILPKRESMKQYKRVPKAKRFEMSCDGFLHLPNSKRIHFQVVDVSDGGLKITAEDILDPGASYALNISIGVMRNTEVIARVVWVNQDRMQIGLEVQSADRNWQRLIRYLEEEFHRGENAA